MRAFKTLKTFKTLKIRCNDALKASSLRVFRYSHHFYLYEPLKQNGLAQFNLRSFELLYTIASLQG